MCVLNERGRCKILDEEKREHIVEAAFEEFVRMLECLKG
jgi:hypothetical protein